MSADDRTFSQEEIDYILSFMDKSTDYCETDEDCRFDEKIRNKLDALKSEITVSELVSELRKRDGVAIFETKENESFEIQTWEQTDKLKYYDSGQGKAIILRITDKVAEGAEKIKKHEKEEKEKAARLDKLLKKARKR